MRIAIVGGGISGSFLFSSLRNLGIEIHLFDQGRGLGGRSSSRYENEFVFDHGAQFFRSDTDEMKKICNDWLTKGLISEWKGPHIGDGDFFGLPCNKDPIYVSAKQGMNNIPISIVQEAITLDPNLQSFQGIRVENIQRSDSNDKWILLGKSGRAAFHDTPENESKANPSMPLHNHDGYDIVVLTDISSSFGNWHRASAGVPTNFAKLVSEKAGSRIPLFSTMVCFKEPLNLGVSSITFDNNKSSCVWFASRTNSKPGFQNNIESWTIISTPEYGVRKITETPMQDLKTGVFIPQSSDYLLHIPAPEMCNEFLRLVGISQDREKVYINAQRWGSAMPAMRHLANDVNSPTRHTIAGVSYDSGLSSLAPTRLCGLDSRSFVGDDDIGLYQIGDMVSSYSPGYEGAVLSAAQISNHLKALISRR